MLQTLATRIIDERHSGVNIAKAICDIASDFEIESIPCLVTDNAANMSVAANEAGLAHTGCLCTHPPVVCRKWFEAKHSVKSSWSS